MAFIKHVLPEHKIVTGPIHPKCQFALVQHN